MVTFILPGYSLKNKDWAEEVKKELGLSNVEVVYWDHWNIPGWGGFDLKKEVEKLIKLIGSEKVNIIAKSIGTRVVMEIAKKFPKNLNKLVLCGIPTKGKSEDDKAYNEGLSKLPVDSVVCIQNTNDPLASYEDIKKFITSINPKMIVIEKDRSDHHYPYSEAFRSFLDDTTNSSMN